MDLGLSGRRVLVTGGSQGIGYAVAAGFLAEGCHVVIVARDQRRLETAVAELAKLGTGKVEAKSIDLAEAGAAESLAAAYPETDILVNNAGAVPIGDIFEIDEARWRAGWDLKVFKLRESDARHVRAHARASAQSYHQRSWHRR